MEADSRLDGVCSTETPDFLWGHEAISRLINCNPRRTLYLLETGQIKSARKIGPARRGRWVVNRAALLRELGAVS